MEAVIIILMHATFLCLSKLLPAESALTHAELEYREANIDLKIQQHLKASPQDHSVEYLAGFILATDIALCILASVKIISHQVRASMHLDCSVPFWSSDNTQVNTHV